MTNSMTNTTALKNEAIQIGLDLISQSIEDEIGTHWLSLKPEENQQFTTQVSPHIYNGSAGIALFLLSLYKETGAVTFLNAGKNALQKIPFITESSSNNNAAFYTGNAGIAFTFLQYYHLTKETRFLVQASQFTKKTIALLPDLNTDDLINGKAGTLIGLLHVYQAIPEKWVLDGIHLTIELLIESACISKGGLYWDRSAHQIDGLCGLSHGASGVGIALLEAGSVLQQAGLMDLARLAFAHENQHFVPDWHNWKDLRKGAFTQAEFNAGIIASTNRDSAYFHEAGNMNAWCHGAAGIGIARLRALSLLNQPQLQSDLNEAIAKVITTDIELATPYSSFNLCHGSGGNLDLLISADYDRYNEVLLSAASRAIEQKQTFGKYFCGYATSSLEEPSLFIGNAGVGYFFLRLLNPTAHHSILLPVVDPTYTISNSLDYDKLSCRKRILEKAFPKSIELSSAIPEIISTINLSTPENLISSFIERLETLQSPGSFLQEAFELEKKAWLLDTNGQSTAEIFFDLYTTNERWRKLSGHGPEGLPMRLINCITDVSGYDYHTGETSRDEYYYLIRKTTQGTSISHLSELGYLVLGCFAKTTSFEEALNTFHTIIEAEEEEIGTLNEAFRNQVISALDQGVLQLQ